jgi:shikimate kinase
MRNSIIYLTGFMTSGKSTVGPILANVLGWDFYDLDKEIEYREKKSIVEMFETKGEKYFREVETAVLKELSGNKDVVISLGGGTITSEVNLNILKEKGKIIYLKVSTDILYHRLKNKIDRPLFRDLTLGQSTEEDFKKKINEILNTRIGYYEKADLVISTDTTRIGITVDILAKKVRALLHEEN